MTEVVGVDHVSIGIDHFAKMWHADSDLHSHAKELCLKCLVEQESAVLRLLPSSMRPPTQFVDVVPERLRHAPVVSAQSKFYAGTTGDLSQRNRW
jgi:hypothetical protein